MLLFSFCLPLVPTWLYHMWPEGENKTCDQQNYPIPELFILMGLIFHVHPKAWGKMLLFWHFLMSKKHNSRNASVTQCDSWTLLWEAKQEKNFMNNSYCYCQKDKKNRASEVLEQAQVSHLRHAGPPAGRGREEKQGALWPCRCGALPPPALQRRSRSLQPGGTRPGTARSFREFRARTCAARAE